MATWDDTNGCVHTDGCNEGCMDGGVDGRLDTSRPLAIWPGRAWLGWPALALPRGGNITELRAEIFSGPHPFDDRPQSILGAEI